MRALEYSGGGYDPRDVLAAVRLTHEPGPAHRFVGRLGPETRLVRGPTLAGVARSLGHTPTQAGAIHETRAALAALEVPAVDLTAARERVASAGVERDRLRERVATLQGRVQALREVGAPVEAAEADLREAVREFSIAETERAAAEQALERERTRAREARDAREERLRLTDRLGNLERGARSELVDSVGREVERARAAVPESVPPESDFAFGLACARVAALEAPVVLSGGAFSDAAGAADWLDAPVVRL